MAVSEKMRKKLEKRKEQLKKNSQGSNKFFIVKEGSTRMRPLPVGEDNEFAIEVVYFYLGEDVKGVISPATFNQPCAIMEMYNEIKDSKDEDDKSTIELFKPKKKYLSPHIRYSDEKGTEIDHASGAKLLMLSGGQYQELIDLFMDDEAGDFTDPKTGYDIKYKRSGKGRFDTEYTMVACKPTKLDKKYNKVYDIEQMVKDVMPSYEETQELVNQALKIDADDDDAPKAKKKSKGDKDKKKKKKSKSDL